MTNTLFDWEQIITTAPYNTINLPGRWMNDMNEMDGMDGMDGMDEMNGKNGINKIQKNNFGKVLENNNNNNNNNDNFSNVNEQINFTKNIYSEVNKYGEPINPRQSHRVPLGTENNYYDPTVDEVNNYLKTNKSMYDNRGKYFDSYLFNQKFDEYIKGKNRERLIKEKVQLYDLDRISNIQIAPYQLPINKLLINLKNVWFDFFDNIINLKNPFENFTTTNFFYYGITLVTIYLLIIMLNYIFS